MSSSSSAVDTLVADLRRIFADRLTSVVVYGPHTEGAGGTQPITTLALVSSLGIGDLEACAARSAGWRRAGLETPLILPEPEFHSSLDTFPLEYGEIIRAHHRVYGNDPFADATIASEDLRRACETQVKSHLVHLREGFIEAAGRPQAINELVAASAPAFTALLRNVGRLLGVPNGDRSTLTHESAQRAGLPGNLVGALLTLEQPDPVVSTDGSRMFPDYLAAVEQLARYVDAWRR